MARRTDDFLQSLGVVIHPSAPTYLNAGTTALLDALSYVNIQHVRGNPALNQQRALRTQLASAGVTVSYTVPAPPMPPTTTTIQAAIDGRLGDIIDGGLASTTDAVEPFNEYDSNPGFVTVLRQAQPYLFAQLRTALGGSAVLGPALIGKDVDTTAPALGDLSPWLDYGNVHSYFGGRAPESDFADRTVDFTSPVGCAALTRTAGDLDDRLVWVATCVAPHAPIVVTEMGYHNDPTSTTHRYTSLAATGVYLPRAFLETFRIGVVRSYSYELFDETGVSPNYEQHFGLFDAARAPKPSAVALHALTSLLRDTGANRATFTPGRLAVTFSTTAGANVRSVLFQKSNGSYWLALWRAVSVFDPLTGMDLPLPPKVGVTLSLPSPMSGTAFADLSTDSTAAGTPLGTSSTFNVQVGAVVTLVRLVP
ncbi:MAG: hypothetical protein IPJ65_13510 [Archangiaceae bacterium]|nr:hypothetical protein [Archangiaceae bacterium]